MLDFAALPPEINSGRMYSGAGPSSLLAAATAWQSLAAELHSFASGYGSILATLTSGPWTGTSSVSMAAAAAPYVTWLSAAGDQAQQAATQAAAAVDAYETAYAATIHPTLIAANRSLLATLVATNVLGQNTPAIMSTEALYAEMWAQDAAAMYGYAGASATASQVTPFSTPPQTTNPSGSAGQVAAAAQSAGTSSGTDVETLLSSGPQMISSTPQTLQSLSTPQALSGLASTTTDTSSSSTSSSSLLNELSTPMRMATMPMSMLSKLFTAGSTATAAKAATTAASELGAVQSAGIGSGAGTLALSGVGGLGQTLPAVTAGMGHATTAGALSVPTAWTGAAAPATGTFLGSPLGGAVPAATSGAHAAMPPMMPITAMSGRGAAATPTRFELRSTVVPFTPAAG